MFEAVPRRRLTRESQPPLRKGPLGPGECCVFPGASCFRAHWLQFSSASRYYIDHFIDVIDLTVGALLTSAALGQLVKECCNDPRHHSIHEPAKRGSSAAPAGATAMLRSSAPRLRPARA